MKRVVCAIALWGLVLGAAGHAQAPARDRCRADALDTWFCPSDPKGVAVVDNLGSVVCAAGECAELDDEWHCSPLSGGRAELTPGGVVCEGGCVSPRAADCERR